MKIIALGAPGVGKGTYSGKLSKTKDFLQISTGDIFRSMIRKKDYLGLEAKKYMNEGKLVPDDLVIDIILKYLKENNIKDNYILDGFPRTLNQAKELDKQIDIDLVLNFTTTKEIIIKRLSSRIVCPKCSAIFNKIGIPPKVEGICDKCGNNLIQREDDTPEAAKRRLEIYEEKTAPLVDYYSNKGLLKTLRIDENFNEYKKEIMGRINNAIGR